MKKLKEKQESQEKQNVNFPEYYANFQHIWHPLSLFQNFPKRFWF